MHHPSTPGATHATSACQMPIADGAPVSNPGPEQLTRAALPLVDLVARRLWLRWGRRHELEELAAIGRAALVPMVRAYDPARAPFVPYAVQRLRWAIQDGVRTMTRGRCGVFRRAVVTAATGRRATGRRRGGVVSEQLRSAAGGQRCSSASTELTVEPPVDADAATAASAVGSPEELLMTKLEAERVRRAVAGLPGHERILVVSHYFQGRRFDHVAAHLGISKSWASRLHNRALRRLGRALHRGRPGAERRALPRGCGSSQRPGEVEASAGGSSVSNTR